MVESGTGRHIYYLTPEQIMQTTKITWIISPFAFLAVIFGRVSFAVSLLVLVGTKKWRRGLLYFIIATQFLTTLVLLGIIMFGCNPVRKYWDRRIPGTCLSGPWRRVPGYVQGGKNNTTIGCRPQTSTYMNTSFEHLCGLGPGIDACSGYFQAQFEEKNQGWPYIPHGPRCLVSLLARLQSSMELIKSYSNMAAAIVTVVALVNAPNTIDITCKFLSLCLRETGAVLRFENELQCGLRIRHSRKPGGTSSRPVLLTGRKSRSCARSFG